LSLFCISFFEMKLDSNPVATAIPPSNESLIIEVVMLKYTAKNNISRHSILFSPVSCELCNPFFVVC
jgi:hypothetical protein